MTDVAMLVENAVHSVLEKIARFGGLFPFAVRQLGHLPAASEDTDAFTIQF